MAAIHFFTTNCDIFPHYGIVFHLIISNSIKIGFSILLRRYIAHVQIGIIIMLISYTNEFKQIDWNGYFVFSASKAFNN